MQDAEQQSDAEEGLDTEQEDSWSVFSTPHDKMMENADPSRDGRTIRTLEDLDITMEQYEIAHNLDSLEFPVPDASKQALILFDALLKLSIQTESMTSDLRNKAPPLTRSLKLSLNKIRSKLISLLADNGTLLSRKQHFRIADEDRAYRADIFVFFGLLQCVCCLAHDQPFSGLLSLHCSAPNLVTLVKHKIVPDNLVDRPFSQYRLPDIMSALKWLETKWLVIPHIACMSIYLDLLMARLAVLCIVQQREHMFGTITDYKQPLSGAMYTHTQRLLEDCCWTFGPMYKKLLMYKRVASQRSTRITISDAAQKAVEKTVVDNAFDMNNKDLIGLFFKTYMKCGLRPSERQKFRRDFQSTAESTPAIIENLRGEDSKRVIMESLARAPWIIAREKLFDKTTTDILHILLLDSFVSNITGLRWMDTFVEFNVQLFLRPNITDHLDRDYPRIIQDFNHFNLLHNQILYMHSSAAKSFIHWLDIMLKAPFNGRFLSRSLAGLKQYTPTLASCQQARQ